MEAKQNKTKKMFVIGYERPYIPINFLYKSGGFVSLENISEIIGFS